MHARSVHTTPMISQGHAMDIQKIAGSFAQNLQKSATARTVYGEPIAADGRTVIPVARVS